MNKITFFALVFCLIAIGLFFWSRTLLAPRMGPEQSVVPALSALPSASPAIQGPSHLPPAQKSK